MFPIQKIVTQKCSIKKSQEEQNENGLKVFNYIYKFLNHKYYVLKTFSKEDEEMTKEVIWHLILTSVKFILLIVCITSVIIQFNFNKILIPVKKPQDMATVLIKKDLQYLGVKKDIEDISYAINVAKSLSNFSDTLITSILYTESRFDKKAISKKGYKGLAQTPDATMKYADVDVLKGVRILEEKMKISNGNINEAIILYKGGGLDKRSARYKMAKNQMEEVLRIHELLSINRQKNEREVL